MLKKLCRWSGYMKKSQNKLLYGLIGVLMAMPIGMVISSLVISNLGMGILDPCTILTSYVVMFGFVLFIAIIMHKGTGISIPRLLPNFSRFYSTEVIYGVVLILAWNIVVTPLGEYIPDFGNNQTESIVQSGVYSVITAIVIAPFIEEFLFRGIFQNNFRKVFGPFWAIIIAAAIFALSHIYPLQVLTAFGAGLILGAIYSKTQSLSAVVLIHVIYNGLIYCLYIVTPKGTDDILLELIPSDTFRWLIWGVSLMLLVGSAFCFFRKDSQK